MEIKIHSKQIIKQLYFAGTIDEMIFIIDI